MIFPIKNRILPLLFISFLVNGCVDSGDIKPLGKLKDANNLVAGRDISAATEATAWPKEHWWESYNDPQLNRLVEAAIANNPTLEAAAARSRQASALAEIAGASLLPRADMNASINRTHWSDDHYYPKTYSGLTDWNNQATLGLSFDLDLWGKHRSELEGALDAVRVADAEAQNVTLSLEGAVVRTYVQLSLSYSLKELLESQAERYQTAYGIASKRLKAGIATELETSQAQAPLPLLRGQVEKLSAQIIVLKNQIAALTGQGPGAGESISRPVLQLSALPMLPSSIPAELVGRRPDITAYRWRVEAASKNIEVAKTQFLPNVNLLATFGSTALTPGIFNFLQSSAVTYGAGPAISLPIFDAGRLRGNLGQATAGYDLAVAQYNDTILHALENIASHIATLRSLEMQHKAAKEAVAVAQRSESITKRGYEGGITEYVNLLTAENQLFDAQKQLAQVEAEQFQERASLAEALGGGFNAEPKL